MSGRLRIDQLPHAYQNQIAAKMNAKVKVSPAFAPKPISETKSATVLALVYFDAENLPSPVCEYRFDSVRKWRFDFAFLDQKVALEVEGGIWTQGRHSRGAGMLADMEKYNTATAQGWRIIRCTPDTLATYATVKFLRDAMAANESDRKPAQAKSFSSEAFA